jgi:hypothetical protein
MLIFWKVASLKKNSILKVVIALIEINTIQQYKTLINEILESKLKKIPEQFKASIPNQLSPVEKLVWIENAETKK